MAISFDITTNSSNILTFNVAVASSPVTLLAIQQLLVWLLFLSIYLYASTIIEVQLLRLKLLHTLILLLVLLLWLQLLLWYQLYSTAACVATTRVLVLHLKPVSYDSERFRYPLQLLMSSTHRHPPHPKGVPPPPLKKSPLPIDRWHPRVQRVREGGKRKGGGGGRGHIKKRPVVPQEPPSLQTRASAEEPRSKLLPDKSNYFL